MGARKATGRHARAALAASPSRFSIQLKDRYGNNKLHGGEVANLTATITACEAVDKGLGRVIEAVKKSAGAMIIIADHGNCEMMIDPETGGPHTAHTTNLVPIIAVGTTPYNTIANGCLADVAPTLLQLMNLPSPPEMTGKTLLT